MPAVLDAPDVVAGEPPAIAAPDGSLAGRSIARTTRNLVLGAVGLVLLGYFAVEFDALTYSVGVLLAGVLFVIPFAFKQTPAGEGRAGARAVTITRRSLVMAVWGLVLFIALYQADGWLALALAGVAIVLPLVLAASRARAARQGRVEYGLLRHPLRRDVRAHLVQGVNVWLFVALLGAAITAGTVDSGQLWLSPTVFDVLHVALWVGLIVLAALALVPLRRVHVFTNVLVVVLSGFLVVQLGRIAIASSDAVVLDSPLRGEWFVADGGRSALINHHYIAVPRESNRSTSCDWEPTDRPTPERAGRWHPMPATELRFMHRPTGGSSSSTTAFPMSPPTRRAPTRMTWCSTSAAVASS